MENASKALIIAGAILLSILIISLGLIVVNNTRRVVDSANVNQQEAQTFNSQFEAWIGNNRSMSDVRALISAVIASNGAQVTNGTTHFIGEGTKTTPTENPGISMPIDLVNGHVYTIEVYNDPKTGFVCGYSVKDNSSTNNQQQPQG